MTYHPFRKSSRYDDPNCGECGKEMFHRDHSVELELARLCKEPLQEKEKPPHKADALQGTTPEGEEK